MRVLALATSYPKHPGDSTAPFIRSIAKGLVDHGAEVDIILPFHPDLDWPRGDPPVRIHTFRYFPGNSQRAHLWGYAGALKADVSLRRRVWGLAPLALGASLLRLARLARSLKPDVIHANWVLPNGPPSVLVGNRLGIPVVSSLHGSGTFLAEAGGVMARAARYTFQGSAGVTACSGDLSRRAQKLGAHPDQVTVIPYGVDPDTFHPPEESERGELRSRLGIPEDAILFLAVGRLVEKKGFRYLLEAFSRAFAAPPDGGGNPLLWIAGSGDLEEDLAQRARNLDLGESLRLLGDVNREGVRELYQAADVLAVPSVRDSAGNVDGLPNVLVEGLGSGKPIVASRVAGIPDVIVDGENGLLVPEKETGPLAEALKILAESPEKRLEMGRKARATVEEHLNWEKISGRYFDVLRSAASGRS